VTEKVHAISPVSARALTRPCHTYRERRKETEQEDEAHPKETLMYLNMKLNLNILHLSLIIQVLFQQQ
jgi:hypothetical protein